MKFSFGSNWRSFSETALTPERVSEARQGFRELTRGVEMRGKSFLDIGFGQGLVLCLATEAGAIARGIDLDPECDRAVARTHALFPSISRPPTQIASVLDDRFVERELSNPGFDVVHSWGVLHHTGDMNHAFRNAARMVKPGGTLIIAIYNRHWTSPIWKVLKIIYNHVPRPVQSAMVWAFYPLRYLREPFLERRDEAESRRGMEIVHDLRDWLGGYPYEYASAKEVVGAFEPLGFRLVRSIQSVGWTGCNQFVFQKRDEALAAGQP